MLDSTQKQQVRNVMGSLFVLGEMFTKYDVTSIMRQEGGQKVYHSDVRAECDFLIANGIMPQDYRISNIRLNTGVFTQVLHPNWKDPNTYNPNALTQGKSGIDPNVDPASQQNDPTAQQNDPNADPTTQNTATAVAPTTAAPVVSPAPTPSVVVSHHKPAPRSHQGNVWNLGGTDKQGRLCIPNSLIRQLAQTGVPSGGKVWVKMEQGSLTLSYSPTLFSTGSEIKAYVVDEDQNVRLSPCTLKKAGLQNSAGFKVTGDQQQIKVEAL